MPEEKKDDMMDRIARSAATDTDLKTAPLSEEDRKSKNRRGPYKLKTTGNKNDQD